MTVSIQKKNGFVLVSSLFKTFRNRIKKGFKIVGDEKGHKIIVTSSKPIITVSLDSI